MSHLTELNVWKKLKELSLEKPLSILDSYPFLLSSESIHLDISNQRASLEQLQCLFNLAHECQLSQKISHLFNGYKVNKTENRPALHTAVRTFDTQPIFVDNEDIIPKIFVTRKKMGQIAEEIRNGEWLGYTGKAITHIVNIGAGGSDLGPRFCIKALSDYAHRHLSYHFVSDIDPTSFDWAVKELNPETTLFIISSKTFATQETLCNAKKAFSWLGHSYFHPQHFIAVTANASNAKQFGIEKILPIWDWIGGRYSFCSAINLITCIAIGFEQFNALLIGANSMDLHFKTNDFCENIPVILALLGIWNINFLNFNSHLLLIYGNKIKQLVSYIQQLDMESNGKSFDLDNKQVNYSTGPVVWGGLGNQIQHSYYQLLCQGTHKVAADFISMEIFDNELINKFCDSKIQVLSRGVNTSHLNGFISGGMPINHIKLKSCSPFCLGELLALYEHKIYTQSVIWNINPFDQPGVESAKKNVAINSLLTN